MSRSAWLIFCALQVAGEICFWMGPHIMSFPGPIVWVSGLALLLPGDVIGGRILEHLLWKGPLTLLQLRLVQVPVEITMNAVVWFACAKLWKLLRGGNKQTV